MLKYWHDNLPPPSVEFTLDRYCNAVQNLTQGILKPYQEKYALYGGDLAVIRSLFIPEAWVQSPGRFCLGVSRGVKTSTPY